VSRSTWVSAELQFACDDDDDGSVMRHHPAKGSESVAIDLLVKNNTSPELHANSPDLTRTHLISLKLT
jgi:hypothetical protein